MRKTILRNFGFGDFEFINPHTGEVIATVRNLKDLQNTIMSIPDESLYYHGSRNHISRWLYSRAMFPIAELLRQKQFTDISESQEMRQLIFDAIVQYRKMKNRGVVAIFQRERFDKYSNFARIGQGSLGVTIHNPPSLIVILPLHCYTPAETLPISLFPDSVPQKPNHCVKVLP